MVMVMVVMVKEYDDKKHESGEIIECSSTNNCIDM